MRVSAQEAQSAGIAIAVSLAPVLLAEPEVETPIEITVAPEAQVPRQSYVRVRGLPLAARLSDGHVITPGSWAIPLSALKSLKVLAPISASGRTEITISVLNVDGAVLAETKSSLVVAPAWLLGSAASRSKDAAKAPQAAETPPAASVTVATAPAPAVTMAAPAPSSPPVAPKAAPPPPPPPAAALAPVASLPPPAVSVAPTPPPPAPPQITAKQPPPASAPAPAAPPRLLTPAEAERAGRLLFQGDNYRTQGNIAAARQFYRRAADMGLALAAMRLAATYDAAELAQLNVQGGIEADAAEARKWYERAKELGAPDADSRITRMAPEAKR